MFRRLWGWLNRPSFERELFHELLESYLIVQLDSEIASAFKRENQA